MSRHFTTDENSQKPGIVEFWLQRFSGGEANAAELLFDGQDPTSTAFITVDVDSEYHTAVTYGDLTERSKRLAQVLADMGVGRGDTVGVLMGQRIELVIALAAILRLGAIYMPLFTAFATAAIDERLSAADARVVVTEPSQIAKVAAISSIEAIVAGPHFDSLIAAAMPMESSVAVGGDSTVVLLFTSGTTGKPKGVPVPLRAIAAFACYMIYGLDVREDDVFWNAADPGWAYGLYYGILGPLAIGRPNVLHSSRFSAETIVQVLRRLGVTNFAAAPTVYRALIKTAETDGVALRRASSAGEPLTPGVSQWACKALGSEVHDHYGQTELGMVINNHWHDEVRQPVVAGSMGLPMPGFSCSIVDGQIAVNTTQSPLMWFAGYHNDSDKTDARFTADKRWYLTADTAVIDDAGHFYFGGRDDDVIIMAGYRIGPFDVESVLITHPAVADVAVVGRPDEVRGEVLEAYVILTAGHAGTDELTAQLQELVKTGYSAHAYPRQVHFVDELPKTPSGKVRRCLLGHR